MLNCSINSINIGVYDKLIMDHDEKIEEKEEIKCPVCESTEIIVEGRCFTCLSCGYSLCGV